MDGFSKLKEKIYEKRHSAIKKFVNIQNSCANHMETLNEIEIRCDSQNAEKCLEIVDSYRLKTRYLEREIVKNRINADLICQKDLPKIYHHHVMNEKFIIKDSKDFKDYKFFWECYQPLYYKLKQLAQERDSLLREAQTKCIPHMNPELDDEFKNPTRSYVA